MTDFDDLSAVQAVISKKREASHGNNSLVVTKTLEPLFAAVLKLTAEVNDLRQEVRRLRFRQSVSNGEPKPASLASDELSSRAAN